MKTMLLMLFVPLAMFSQREYKKAPEGFCKVNHKCNLKIHEDKFEKETNFEIPDFDTAIDKKRQLSYGFNKTIKGEYNIIFWSFSMTYVRECRTSDSFVSFEFEDGEILKVPNTSNSIDCGTSFILINITNLIDEFIDRHIKTIRIHLTLDHDYVVTDKAKIQIKDNLKCIKKAGTD